MSLLAAIESPADLKRIAQDDLPILCAELRERIIEVVSRNGGHLAPSLGVVELAVALHYVFESPVDPIVWDVGDQAYAHKLLTGRRERFDTLRQSGGLSGFTRRDESVHDPFGAGHASTGISAAIGIAEAKRLKGEPGRVVAVIGDGGMTGGMAFEALNHAGSLGRDLVVVLNDNGMFISPRVGAMSHWLSHRFAGRGFNLARRRIKDLLTGFPRWGDVTLRWIRRGVESTKVLLTPGILFEGLNFQYIGPVDGHDLAELIPILQNVRMLDGPSLVHVRTVKGKGLPCAEKDPSRYHGVAPSEPETSRASGVGEHRTPSYTSVFSRALVELGQRDERIVAITAAMPDGTGLSAFAERFPGRFYDVGIAEEHAVTFAAGLACQGFRPVVAIYSTFLQRAYDQILHDVCLQRLPVTFVLDRAGLVGEDGPTHHGAFDLSYLSHLPEMAVLAPADEAELVCMLSSALDSGRPAALRFPRGAGAGAAYPERIERLPFGRGRVVHRPAGRPEIALLSVGTMLGACLQAARRLEEREGLPAAVCDVRFVKPLDRELVLRLASETGQVLTIEEASLIGGFGQQVCALLQAEGLAVPVASLGIPDRFIAHGPAGELRRELGLDPEGIARAALALRRRGVDSALEAPDARRSSP
ncbi:MAG: 1-deoxy-D-xylulose-5-phosphate synthase [Deltaproteobacteria bacterium]|nr:1-deoxy-D-xylulose-5-phosphate synthase [Deltaproteobacteria bacterium]